MILWCYEGWYSRKSLRQAGIGVNTIVVAQVVIVAADMLQSGWAETTGCAQQQGPVWHLR